MTSCRKLEDLQLDRQKFLRIGPEIAKQIVYLARGSVERFVKLRIDQQLTDRALPRIYFVERDVDFAQCIVELARSLVVADELPNRALDRIHLREQRVYLLKRMVQIVRNLRIFQQHTCCSFTFLELASQLIQLVYNVLYLTVERIIVDQVTDRPVLRVQVRCEY